MRVADRREEEPARTDRPDAAAVMRDRSLPTLGEVLESAALAAGGPEVLVGGTSLSAPVRWVHVSDSPGVARLLEGGELLLTTASAWPDDPGELRALVAELVRAGLVGIVIELGAHYRYVPAVVVEAATEAGLALVALHREIKFVSVTEVVHRRIVAEQYDEVAFDRRVHETFTELSKKRASVAGIVAAASRMLDLPVVLEDLAHQAIATSGGSAAELLDDWERRSRATPAHWVVTPVGPRGEEWGRLIVPAGADHRTRTSMVLERASAALAIRSAMSASSSQPLAPAGASVACKATIASIVHRPGRNP